MSLRHALLVAGALLLAGCATEANHYDPLEPVNRKVDAFNDALDRALLDPLTRGYRAVMPDPFETMLGNAFSNLGELHTALGDFLQGKGKDGFIDLGRFVVNSTIGIFGLFDVASAMGLQKHDEDCGQAFARWGWEHSTYLVLPVLGPTTARDSLDYACRTFTDPTFYVSVMGLMPTGLAPVVWTLKLFDARTKADQAIKTRRESALDPYVFTREGWLQNRLYKIYDGHPPDRGGDDWGDEDDFDDEE